MDPIRLAQALVRCPSVTPVDAGALDLVQQSLSDLGFTCHRLVFGDPPNGPVQNLFATIGEGPPHFAFAGHTDVVPEGTGWSVDPYAGVVENGYLIGRGAADMKSAIAAMISAASAHVARNHSGTLSFIITGDEEGPATFGTDQILEWMQTNNQCPDMCLVGEPTSVHHLGDMMKIGRRGSLNCWITVNGAQGHVAYPDRADNPIPRLLALLQELQERSLDSGTAWFSPSNLEIVDLHVGNPATNVIPASASARLNIRFNDTHTGVQLTEWIRSVAERHGPSNDVNVRISGEAFITQAGALSTMVSDSVQSVTGRIPELSTSGGTSDARFIRRVCPVVEFGLPGASMHKLDEKAALVDIASLARIYDHVLYKVFSGSNSIALAGECTL